MPPHGEPTEQLRREAGEVKGMKRFGEILLEGDGEAECFGFRKRLMRSVMVIL